VRAVYSTDTDPTLKEINKKLIMAETVISREIKTSFKPQVKREETMWYQYARSDNWYIKRGTSRRFKADTPSSVNLEQHPIISITSLTCIVNDAELDLVASSDYTEGWNDSYYIDYQNGIIFFMNFVPRYNTPVKVTYTYGYLETKEGDVIHDATIASVPSETTLTFAESEDSTGVYDGKLIELSSGVGTGDVYRIVSSTWAANVTTITVLDGYTLQTDGVLATDTLSIYSIPADITEMTCLHAHLMILGVDPTYLYTLTNPPEEFAPQYNMIDNLINRLAMLIKNRSAEYTLLN